MDKKSLCLSYLMDEASREEIAELSAWIAESPENAQQFALLAAQDAYLSTAIAQCSKATQQSPTLLEELAELERMSEPAQLVDVTEMVLERQRHDEDRLRDAQASAKQADVGKASNRRQMIVVIPKAAVWLGLAAAVMLAATVLFYVLPPSDGPHEIASPPDTKQINPNAGPAFAAVVRGLDTRWESNENASGLLRQGEHTITEGMVELELLSGTRVVIEAPATFVLTDINQMELRNGRVVASVPRSGTGFILDTPNARFVETAVRLGSRIDLGHNVFTRQASASLSVSTDVSRCVIDASFNENRNLCFDTVSLVNVSPNHRETEFGVYVDGDIQTRVQVFRGEILTSPMIDRKPAGDPIPVAQSEAAVITHGGTGVALVDFDEMAFKREITTRLSLADMMMGGDGTTGRQNIGLHPLTGQYMRNVSTNSALVGLISTGRAQPVPRNDYITSVFIPSKDGRLEGLPSGLSLPNLPQTTGVGYGVIWSGAEMPSVTVRYPIGIPTKLPGYNFVGAGQQALVMHTNCGVVIDLDAVRRMNPDYEIVAVQAVTGNASGPSEAGGEADFRSEFLTYLDSELAMRSTFVRSNPDELRVAHIDLSVHASNRYLTFVSTDGGDGNHQDWVILGDPVVILKPIERSTNDF